MAASLAYTSHEKKKGTCKFVSTHKSKEYSGEYMRGNQVMDSRSRAEKNSSDSPQQYTIKRETVLHSGPLE